MVIDAEDGTYRALDLPGFEGRRTNLRLSPDGNRLAWTWSDGDNLLETIDPRDGIGLRVLDLTTGEFESYDLRDNARHTFVLQVSWSPDGRWLVWDGMEAGGPSVRLVAGRIGPDGATVRLPRPRSFATTRAVGDDGVVLIAGTDELLHWDGEVIDTAERTGDRAPVVVTPRAGVLVEATLDDLGRTVDYRLADGTEIPEWKGRQVKPLGQLDDGAAVVVLLGGSWEDPTSTEPPPDWALQLLDASSGRVTSVGTLPSGVNDLAVGLMTTDQPTVSRSGPDEPGWRPDTSLLIGLGVAGVLGGLAGLRWLRRRYRAAWPGRGRRYAS